MMEHEFAHDALLESGAFSDSAEWTAAPIQVLAPDELRREQKIQEAIRRLEAMPEFAQCDIPGCQHLISEDWYCEKHQTECKARGCSERELLTNAHCKHHSRQQQRKRRKQKRQKKRLAEEVTKPKICTFPGCKRRFYAKKLCRAHYVQSRSGGVLKPLRTENAEPCCIFVGCSERHHARGYCQFHLNQLKSGIPLTERPIKPRTCKFPGCDKPVRGRGYCSGHYEQLRQKQVLRPLNQKPQPRICSIDGCQRKHLAKGLCSFHYQRHQAGLPLTVEKLRYRGKTCKVPGCAKKHRSRGFCEAHYSAFKKGRITIPPDPSQRR